MDKYAGDLPRLSWSQVCARRLDRHGLTRPAARPADAAGAMCGAHAQVLTAGELSLGLRLEDARQADVRAALWNEHSLVKTYGPRGTVHLLPTRDLPMWCGALSALPPAPNGYPEGVRLTPAETEVIVEAVASILADAELTSDELTAALVDRVGPWAGEMIEGGFQQKWPRWRQAIVVAANRGALCFGPNKGRNVSYTNPRRWLPRFEPADGERALAEVIKRYLHAYGPATHQHFARWFAAPPGWVNNLFGSLGSALEQVEVEGRPAWVVAGDTGAPEEPPRGVRLLPYFDAYAVGCHPRELVFPKRAFERALSNGQAGTFPVLLMDGVVSGIWHQRRSGKKLFLTVEPFQDLTARQRSELDEQIARVAEFIDAKPEMTIGMVTTGSHA